MNIINYLLPTMYVEPIKPTTKMTPEETTNNLIGHLKSEFQKYLDLKDTIRPEITDARAIELDEDGNMSCKFTDATKLALMYRNSPSKQLTLHKLQTLEDKLSELYEDRANAKHGEKGILNAEIANTTKLISALRIELAINTDQKRAHLITQRLKHCCEIISQHEGYHLDVSFVRDRLYVYRGNVWLIVPIDKQTNFTKLMTGEIGPSVGVVESDFKSDKAVKESINTIKTALNETYHIDQNDNTGKVAFNDVTYNFFTKKTTPHNPKDYVMHHLDMDFKELDDIPTNDKELLNYIQKHTKGVKLVLNNLDNDINLFRIICEHYVLGLSRTDKNPKMVLLKGPTKTGKSDFLKALLHCTPHLTHEFKIENLCHKVGYTRGQELKRAGTKPIFISHETPRHSLHATSFKTYVRQEDITMELKGQDHVPHPCKFRMFAASNHDLKLDEGGEQVEDRCIVIPFQQGYKERNNNLLDLLKLDCKILIKILVKTGMQVFEREGYEYTESEVSIEAQKQSHGSAIKGFIEYLGYTYAKGKPNYHQNKKLFNIMFEEYQRIASHKYYGNAQDARNEVALSLCVQKIEGSYRNKKNFNGVVTSDYLHLNIDESKVGKFQQLYTAAIQKEKRVLGYQDRPDQDGNLIKAKVAVWKELRIPEIDFDGKNEDPDEEFPEFGTGTDDEDGNPF